MFVLITGTLWRDPAARMSKAGKQYVTCLIKTGAPTDTIWCNVIAFDQVAQSELLRLSAGDALAVQGVGRLSVFEKDGQHRPSLDVTAAHVLALRQPKPVKTSKANVEAEKQREPEFADEIPF